MKRFELTFACLVALALPGSVAVQANRPAAAQTPVQTPAPSVVPGEASGSGMVRVPPVTDPKVLSTPPKNIDPAIDDATGRIDRKNRDDADSGKAGKSKNKGSATNKDKASDRPIGEYK